MYSTASPQSATTTDLVTRLVDDMLPEAVRGTDASTYVTGTTAAQVDFRDLVAERLPWIIAVVVKMPGLGLAVSVLIDATVVRLLLVPAVMMLLGRHAWWTPHRLDRPLPHIGAEGEGESPAAGR